MADPKPLDTQTIENDIKFIYDQGGSDEDVDSYLEENGVDYETHQASTDKQAEDSLAEATPEAKKPEMLDVFAGSSPEQMEESGHPYVAAAQKTGKAMATPALHYLNQRALNIPRQAAEAAGMEYVGDTGNPLVEGVSRLAGVAGGARTLSKLKSFTQSGDKALVKAGKGALEGAAAMGVMSGAQNIMESAGKFASGDVTGATQDITEFGKKLGVGALAGAVASPALSKAGDMLGKISKASIGFYRKNAAGYSQQFADTLHRLGSAKVFDPLKATGEYVSKTLVPKVSKEVSRLLTSRNPKNAIEVLEYLKLKPEEIEEVLALEPRYKLRLAEGATKSGYEIFKTVEKEGQEIGNKIGEVLGKAQSKGQLIKINETMNLFKKTLLENGLILQDGSATTLVGQSDLTTQQLVKLWGTLNQMTTTPNFRFRTPIDVAGYKAIKNNLEAMLKTNEAKNIPIYAISRRLVKDVSNQIKGIKGLYNKYSQLMTYKDVWRKLYDKTSPTAIENVLNNLRAANPNQGMARVLFSEKFTRIFGKDTTDELLAWIAAQEHQETVGLARGAMRVGYNTAVRAREAVSRSATKPGGVLANTINEFSPGTKKAASKIGAAITGGAASAAGTAHAQATTGQASTYGWGEKLNENTASGEKFKPNAKTAAMYDVPFGTEVEVTDNSTGKKVTVTINDRGPNKRLGRLIDLSKGAWKALGYSKAGLTDVSIKILKKGAKK